ncbi:YitT family protein [Hutsoniella sourekii]
MTWQEALFSLFLITIGSLIYCVGMNAFILPNSFTTGGVTGISVLLYYVFQIPVSIMNLGINLVLLIIGLRFIDKRTIILTIVSLFWISLFLDIVHPPVFHSENLIITAVAGGVLTGIGMGLVLRGHGTTAGSDIIAMLMQKYLGMNFSAAVFLLNCLVILASLYTLTVELTIVTIMMIFVSANVINIFTEGLNRRKAIFIISSKHEEIAHAVVNEIGRGVTVLHAHGYYSKKQSDVLYCVVNRYQVIAIRRVIDKIDERAFVSIMDIQDVTGQGFSYFNKGNKNDKFYLK